MPTFANLSARVTPEARKFLDFLWEYYLQHGDWPTHRVVYGKFTREPLLALVRTLDGTIVREVESSNGQKSFQLPLLGILSTSHGEHYQKLLFGYLSYLREIFFRSTDINSIKHNEVQQALKLSPDDTVLLGRLIFSGFMRASGGYQPNFSEWGTSLPSELEDLPSEGPLDAVFTELLDQYAGQTSHIFLADRMVQLGSPHPAALAEPEVLPDKHAKLPGVFISYSHDNRDHKRWVLGIAEQLHQAHIDVIIDQWDLGPGDDFVKFMEQGVTKADRVLMLCTAPYVTKVNEGKGGAGYEAMVVTGELIKDLGTAKFIPVFCPPAKVDLPTCVQTRFGIDLSGSADFEDEFKKLVANLRKERPAARPLRGPTPNLEPPVSATAASSAPAKTGDGQTVLCNASDSSEVYRDALNLALAGDLVSWRKLVTSEKRRAEDALKEWRKTAGDTIPQLRKDLPEFMLRGVSTQERLFALAIAGVESEAPKFRGQASLIYDLLQPNSWERSGLTRIVDFPEANAFVLHALLGAMCVYSGQIDLALDLATQRITNRSNPADSGPLFLDHPLTAWPSALDTYASDAWNFLTELPKAFTWLSDAFGSTEGYRESLVGYYLLLGWLEYLHFVEENLADDSAKKARLEIPPVYLRDPIFSKAARLLFQNRPPILAYGEKLAVPAFDQKARWPMWCELQTAWWESITHFPENLPPDFQHFADDLHR